MARHRMTGFPHLGTRLFNTPLAITPRKAEIVMAALGERLGITHLFRANGSMLAFDDAATGYGTPADEAGYDVIRGVALVPVCGTLVQKLGTMRPYSGMTGYDGIRANLSLAIEDPDVRAIVLDIDSPGGEVAGCFDLVDMIYQARGVKPIIAILSECAYSAAYALASAASHVIVPRTGGTGSVGVIMMHVDLSRALSGAGIVPTFITYGERKADGHPEIPLSADARDAYQGEVDEMGELFVQTVARNRGMSAKAVRETQAAIFLGQHGVDIGFADEVMAPDAAFAALVAGLT